MSDSFITVVPELVSLDKAKVLGKLVLDNLVKNRIVEKIKTDCILGGTGHAPSTGYQLALAEKHERKLFPAINGLEVITERSIFENGGNGLDALVCPLCDVNNIKTNWHEAIGEWYNNTGNGLHYCSNCKSKVPIVSYHFVPTWAFGALGFKFWNWPTLNEEFVNDIGLITQRAIRVVNGRV